MVSINGDTQKLDGLFHGESQSKMDDDILNMYNAGRTISKPLPLFAIPGWYVPSIYGWFMMVVWTINIWDYFTNIHVYLIAYIHTLDRRHVLPCCHAIVQIVIV